MYKSIQDVQVGDTILEPGGGSTKVTKVEHGPKSCVTKVHINQKDCYEGFARVNVSDSNN
jgi:hypothetical protein